MAMPLKPVSSTLLSTLRLLRLVSDADLDKVWNNCLEPMLIMYYPPHRAADEGELAHLCGVALRDYVEDLAEFSSEILLNAWRETRRAHKGQGWPTIAAIRDRCVAQLPPSNVVRFQPGGSYAQDGANHVEGQLPQHRIMADAWVRSSPGQRALAAGNAYDGWLYVARHGRHPSDQEMERQLAARQRALVRLKDLQNSHALMGYYRTMEEHEEELRQQFGRGAA